MPPSTSQGIYRESGTAALRTGDYDYTRTLPPSLWAWEFLRRNEIFRAEVAAQARDSVSVKTVGPRLRLVHPRREQMAAERWGLSVFPDPDHDARTADVFWLGSRLARQVHMQVSPVTTGRMCSIYRKALRLCNISHLVDIAGREHLLVRGNNHTVQVRCAGVSLLSGEPVRLGFLIPGESNFQYRLRALQEARKVLESPGRSAARHWSRTSLSLRNALIAHDCMSAGMSTRQTASVIYGQSRVQEAWAMPGRAMKDEIRRARARGTMMVAGGYEKLLGGARGGIQARLT